MLFLVKKSFRGGIGTYYIRLDKKPNKSQWDCVLEWIGENTNGGHAYGYHITCNPSRRKTNPPKEMMLKLPRYLMF